MWGLHARPKTQNVEGSACLAGAGKNSSHGAKTNNAIMQIACPHDLKASAADGEWRPDTVKTTQDDEREFFSPAQATPLNAQESVAPFDF